MEAALAGRLADVEEAVDNLAHAIDEWATLADATTAMAARLTTDMDTLLEESRHWVSRATSHLKNE